MSLFVNASQEEAFRLVIDYFTGRRMKILTLNSPSYVRAEFGSWTSISLGNSKGEVEIDIVKRNDGSYINLNLNFLKEYLVALVFLVVGALITHILYEMLAIEFWFTLFVVFTMVTVIFGLLAYDTSLTRRRFVEEFNMFIQPFASKKD